MRKAFAIWLMAGLPVLADSVAATRSWVSNRVAEARAEWRGEVVAATNPVPSWISAAEGRTDARIASATNGLPERMAALTNGLPERIAAVTDGLPERMAALTNGLPAKIAAVTNGLPEAIAGATNGLPERIASVTNGLPERIASVTNDLPERLAAVTSGVPALVSAATGGVMGEVAAATGSLWTAIGNIEGVTADIGALARTNDIPAKVSQLDNDLGFLTNHQDLAAYALSAGIFPDWTSKGTWSEGEFCTWKGKVYRLTGEGDAAAQPDYSGVSWAETGVWDAIARAVSGGTNGLYATVVGLIGGATNGLPERIASVTNGLPERIASVTNGLPEALMEAIVASTNGLPEMVAGSTNDLPERIASVTNGLPERIASVTNDLPERLAAVTNGLPEMIAGSTNGLPERIASVTNGLPERMAALTNGLPEMVAGSTNGLYGAVAAATNGLPERIVAATNGVMGEVNAVMGEVNAATGSLWRAIGNIEGVTADIGALARTNDLPTRVSQLQNDMNFLTNHQDLTGLAFAAGVFPDWSSKGSWAEGEFCTWKGVVYRRSRNGDGSTAPDISPVSWIASDVGTAIAEARPDMSSLTNPIPTWIAAATNGMPERIAAATNGLPARIAAVTNGLPARIAAVTNGLPELVAASTNGLPEAIVAATNGVVERATEAAIGAVAGLDAKTAYRLSGPPPYDRSWIDGTGAVYEAHAAPLIVSNGVTWTRLRNDRLFPTAAESITPAGEGDDLTWEWTNGVNEVATWGLSQAQDLDGGVYGGEYPECVFFTKHMTFADIDPDPSWVAYGITMHLDPSYRWGWTSARLTVIYRSPYMPSGIAGTELHFVTAAVQSASGTYPATLVSASTNATNAVISVNVTGFPNAVLTTGITRTLTLPRTVTFTPYAVPVMVDRLAMESVIAESAVTVDPALSPTSENPVQNKVVTGALASKLSRAEAEAGFTEWSYIGLPESATDVVVTPPIGGSMWLFQFSLDGIVFSAFAAYGLDATYIRMTFQDGMATATYHVTATRVRLPTMADLDGKASTNDVQLSPVYSQTPTFSEWTIPDYTNAGYGGKLLNVQWDVDAEQECWEFVFEVDAYPVESATDQDALTVSANFDGTIVTATRTRTDIIGYTLGAQTNSILAATNAIPSVPVKAVKRNGTALTPDENGAVNVLVPTVSNTYDFATNVGLYTAVRDIILALGGTVTNFPSISQGGN